MDSYQAVYDAVRSKISAFDGNALGEDIVGQFDFSHHAENIKQEFMFTAAMMQRPCVLFRPKIFIDGSQWCALYGDNLQDGVAGFGDSVEKAMEDFDKNWQASL